MCWASMVCYVRWADEGCCQKSIMVEELLLFLNFSTQRAHHWLLLRQWCCLNQLVSILGVQRCTLGSMFQAPTPRACAGPHHAWQAHVCRLWVLAMVPQHIEGGNQVHDDAVETSAPFCLNTATHRPNFLCAHPPLCAS